MYTFSTMNWAKGRFGSSDDLLRLLDFCDLLAAGAAWLAGVELRLRQVGMCFGATGA